MLRRGDGLTNGGLCQQIAAYAPLTESTFDRLVSIEDAKLRTVITEVRGHLRLPPACAVPHVVR